jgi:flagellar biosynthesis/type III secretory pathway M-ring protein FliF/YscJ
MLFQILSYLWIAFMAAVVLVPTIIALTSRPKRSGGKPAKKKKKKGKKGAEEEENQDQADHSNDFAEQTLDFGDELAQMEQSKA